MKKFILITLSIFTAAIIAIFVVVALRPSKFHVERSATMAAPPAAVFAQINDFHNWNNWSPWDSIDPNLEQVYEGSPSGEGAIYRWIGNNQVGEGKMTITESRPNEYIGIKLEFYKPMEGVSTAEFTLKPEGDGTNVTWAMDGTNNFIGKAVDLFMGMDAMIGKNFEDGLATMKQIVESAPTETASETTAAESTGPLTLTREYDAPLAKVWQAWTDAKVMQQWWGPTDFTNPTFEADFREGGKYLYCMQAPDGQQFWGTGTYQTIEPMTRIVASDSFADENGNVVPASHYGMGEGWAESLTITTTFAETNGKTTVTMQQVGLPSGPERDMCAMGWNQSFDKLAAVLQTL